MSQYPSPPKMLPTTQQPITTSAIQQHTHLIHTSLAEQLYYALIHSIERQSQIHKFDAIQRIDALGYNVGTRLAHTIVNNIASMSTQLEPLERVKYVCKEIWLYSFNKQIDKLQTNYKGIYVLHDYNFKYIAHLQPTLINDILLYTTYPCALIRGVLSTIGMNVTVKADISKWPNILFTLIDTDATAKLPVSTGSTSATVSTTTSPVKPNTTPLYANNNSTTTNQLLPNIAAMHIAPPPPPASRPTSQSSSQPTTTRTSRATSSVDMSEQNTSIQPSVTHSQTLNNIASAVAAPIAVPSNIAAPVTHSHSSTLLNYYQANASPEPNSTKSQPTQSIQPTVTINRRPPGRTISDQT